MKTIQLVTALLITVSNGVLAADKLELSNGDVITGSLVRSDDRQLVWESPILGTLHIPTPKVSKLNGVPLAADGGDPENAAEQPGGSTNMEPSRRFAGEFELGLERNTGSSDSEEREVRLEASLERGLSIARLALEHEFEEQRGRVTEEDYGLEITAERYSRSADKGRYFYARGSWNKDRFRATDKWRAIGAGIGYVWRPTSNSSIRLQGGVDNWWFSLQEDLLSALGGRLLIDLRHTFTRPIEMTIFSEAQFLWEIGGRGTHLVETTSGLRIPISRRLYAQMSLDHDRFESIDVPEFRADQDTEWNFKLGYKW